MAVTRREALNDPLIRELISTYAWTMNERYKQEVVGSLASLHPQFAVKQMPDLYDPLFLDSEIMGTITCSYSWAEISLQTLRNPNSVGINNVTSARIVTAPSNANLLKRYCKTLLDFIRYQERVYVRVARALIEQGEERGCAPQELIAIQASTDEALRRAVPKRRQAHQFYTDAIEAMCAFATVTRHQASVTGIRDPALYPDEQDIELLRHATLEFVVKELERVYPT